MTTDNIKREMAGFIFFEEFPDPSPPPLGGEDVAGDISKFLITTSCLLKNCILFLASVKIVFKDFDNSFESSDVLFAKCCSYHENIKEENYTFKNKLIRYLILILLFLIFFI